jgi:hypothetical protein
LGKLNTVPSRSIGALAYTPIEKGRRQQEKEARNVK